MSPACAEPISWEELVAYWANDVDPEALDRLDTHLMSCAFCTAESARVASVTEAMRALIPPFVDHGKIEALRARGLRIVENSLLAEERRTVAFARDTDILLHRLGGLDLHAAERVSVCITAEETGDVLIDEPSVPFDAGSGEVLVACQRHFAAFPHNVVVEVRTHRAGAEHVARYPIPHVFHVTEA